ncbi:hypothetical protein PGQ11_003052 [Apiospora arundinis]|uniref:Uncharacterized protein n=1 Tax=Apiospora arundinis TaxID=335852 RepID=A0ABR2J404_9PEZI
MAQHAFAQQVACMEGKRRITPPKEILPVTLENMHARLHQLERASTVKMTQPPTALQDWDSLQYRTMRLWRENMPAHFMTTPFVITCDKWFPQISDAGEDDETQRSMEIALQRTLYSIGIFSYSANPKAKDAEATDDVDSGNSSSSSPSSSSSSSSNQFDIAAQELCRMVGENRKRIQKPFLTVRELYAASIEMSLVLEGRAAPTPPAQPPFCTRPHMPPGGPPPPPPRKRRSSYCPSCKCGGREKKSGFFGFMCGGRRSDDSDSGSDSDSDAGSTRCAKRTGWRRLLPNWGWLSKGRKKRRSGYGSVTTSSASSTLAD